MFHPVIYQRIIGGMIGGRNQVEDHTVCRSYFDSLHTVKYILGIAVIPYPFPDPSYGMKCRGFIDHGVYKINTYAFTGLGFQRQTGVGVMQPSGASVQLLTSLFQAGVGVEIFTGTGIQVLAGLTQLAIGATIIPGAGVQILATLIQTGTGTEIFVGTAAQTLAALTQAGVGTLAGVVLFVAEFIPLELLTDIGLAGVSDIIVTLGRDVGV